MSYAPDWLAFPLTGTKQTYAVGKAAVVSSAARDIAPNYPLTVADVFLDPATFTLSANCVPPGTALTCWLTNAVDRKYYYPHTKSEVANPHTYTDWSDSHGATPPNAWYLLTARVAHSVAGLLDEIVEVTFPLWLGTTAPFEGPTCTIRDPGVGATVDNVVNADGGVNDKPPTVTVTATLTNAAGTVYQPVGPVTYDPVNPPDGLSYWWRCTFGSSTAPLPNAVYLLTVTATQGGLTDTHTRSFTVHHVPNA